MKNRQVIKLPENATISINEHNELIIEDTFDPCEGVIYSTIYDELGSPTQLSTGTLSDYLRENTYIKNTLFGEIYSFTGWEKIEIIKDAYIQGYRDALDAK